MEKTNPILIGSGMNKGRLLAIMAMAGMLSEDSLMADTKMIEYEAEQRRDNRRMNKPAPKGTKHYFFDYDGNFSTDHMLKTSVMFECFAVNDKNALRKYNKRFK